MTMNQGAGKETEMNDVVAFSALILEVLIEERGKSVACDWIPGTAHAATGQARCSWMQRSMPPG